MFVHPSSIKGYYYFTESLLYQDSLPLTLQGNTDYGHLPHPNREVGGGGEKGQVIVWPTSPKVRWLVVSGRLKWKDCALLGHRRVILQVIVRPTGAWQSHKCTHYGLFMMAMNALTL